MPNAAPHSQHVTAKRTTPRIGVVLSLCALMLFSLLPVFALIWLAVGKTSDVWPHLVQYVLPRTLWHTTALLVLVGFGTALLGAGTAWLTTLCRFPGRSFFAWALVLPLAVPTYIAAYSHVEFFDFSGPLQSLLRSTFGYSSARDYWFPDIRSLEGAGLIFSLVLYPYVFLTCRLIFSMQGASALDISRSLGARPIRMFFQIGLPMARPALAAGVALALMETLNDIGAVEFLGVKTLPYAVFETWLNRDSLAGAMQLALATLVLVIGLVWLERHGRRNRNYSTSTRERPPARMKLSRAKQALAVLACGFPLLGGLGIPLYVLGSYAVRRTYQFAEPELLTATLNSLTIAFSTALLTTLLAYGILLYVRISRNTALATVGRLSSLGYAVPGTVLALGLLVSLAGFDNWFDGLMRSYFGISTGLFFSGSILIVIYACTLRFLAIAYGTIETGFSRVSSHVDMAARALGRTSQQMAIQIHTPIMGKALGTAFLLVFVDTSKELSATLLLRPFGFETLGTLIYDRASQAALEDAAVASLIIILIGLFPVIFVTQFADQKHRRTSPKS